MVYIVCVQLSELLVNKNLVDSVRGIKVGIETKRIEGILHCEMQTEAVDFMERVYNRLIEG